MLKINLAYLAVPEKAADSPGYNRHIHRYRRYRQQRRNNGKSVAVARHTPIIWAFETADE